MGPFAIDSQRQLRVCDQFDMGIDAIILDLCVLNYEISTSRSIGLNVNMACMDGLILRVCDGHGSSCVYGDGLSADYGAQYMVD